MINKPHKKSTNKVKKNNVSLYRNLANRRKAKKNNQLKQRAEYLANLPKHPVRRFFFHLHPKRIFKFIFSKRGLIAFVKLCLMIGLIIIVFLGGLFLHYRREIDSLRPEEVAKRIKTTVNSYYDRNGKLLWEDKGNGNYTLAVKDEDINDYVKKATIAIEDRDFYKHHGISITGLARAMLNNLKGGHLQGGSTLTQQLIKQAFFSEEAHKRGLNGVPRKIKEMILAVELERLYTKDQIITMYLNESPYGGRRNGIESGAQTYFGKTAKDLTLAEAALLAGIPNQPGLYNPYNINGNKALIRRQHKVLNDMVEIGAVSQEEANKAKEVAILDTIKPESDQWKNIKAPHFVLEAKKQLETKFGVKMVRSGGLKITTTLDLEAQQAAEAAVAEAFKMSKTMGSDNMALGSLDVKTAQVIAMVGSVDFNRPGYGQINAAISELEPGSSIKPIVDFAPLFMQREGMNYGPGSILKDEDIRNIYCRGSAQGCDIQNYTHMTYGNVTIRESLGSSLNRPAIKAMYIVGVDKAIETARKLGDKSYCLTNNNAGLSAAIGGGCTLRLIEHANTYASLARGGVYQDIAYLLEVKNSDNDELYKWQEKKGEKVLDPQAAYMLSDILSDPAARAKVFGSAGYSYGFLIPKVWTASKTGTTDNGKGRAKDSWMMSYSPVIATGVWSGNHNGAPLANGSNNIVRRAMHNYMSQVHLDIYAKQGKWKSGDKIAQPAGIKKMTFMGKNDIWPSWFKPSNFKKEKVVFDKISKRLATECTPELAKVEFEVYKFVDPISKKEVLNVPSEYDYKEKDNIHKCSDIPPTVSLIQTNSTTENKYDIIVDLNTGTYSINEVKILINDQLIHQTNNGDNINIEYDFEDKSEATIKVIVTDNNLYQSTKTITGPTVGVG